MPSRRKSLSQVSTLTTGVVSESSFSNDVLAVLKSKSVYLIKIGINRTLEPDCEMRSYHGNQKSEKVIVEEQKLVDNGLDKDMGNFVNIICFFKMKELKYFIASAFYPDMACRPGNIAFPCGNKLYLSKSANMFSDEAVKVRYFALSSHNGYLLKKCKLL